MVKKKKKKEDPYSKVRRDVPPPDYLIGFGKEYNRNRNKKVDDFIINEGLDEYYHEDINYEDLVGSICRSGDERNS